MTVKNLLLSGITVLSLGGALFWWSHLPSEPTAFSALPSPANKVAGSMPGNQLSTRLAMLESLLADESSARKRIELRLQALEERLQAVTRIERTSGLENRRTDTLPVKVSRPPESLRDKLVKAGIASDIVEQMLNRIGKNRMELLSMRDKAAREGWIDADEYMTALEALSDTSQALRTEFGDSVYDEYLYAAGKPNRVMVTDIYPHSAAEDVGLRPGDVVMRYASVAIFSMRDVREATASGDAADPVIIEWQRDGVHMNAIVPRGPLGVEMEEVQINDFLGL